MWTLAISRWFISSAFQAAEEVRVLMAVPFSQDQRWSVLSLRRSGPERDDPLRFDREHDAHFPGADRGIGVAACIFLSHAVHVVHRAFRGTMDYATAYFHPKVGTIRHKDCGKTSSLHIAGLLPIRSGVHAHI